MDETSGALTVRVQEYVPETEAEVGRSYNLLRQIYVDFHLGGFHEVEGLICDLRAAWHVDTHIYTGTPTHAVHPRFHFQVGGEQLDEIDANIRGVLMPETPRMPCAPLDGILAIDFVLCALLWAPLV